MSEKRIRYSDAESCEEGGKCPDCGVSVGDYHQEGCDIEECEHCSGQQIGCSCHGIEYSTEFASALADLQAVCVRIGVMAAHTHDLIQAHTPEASRALCMLNEIDLLTKDGMSRIAATGLEF